MAGEFADADLDEIVSGFKSKVLHELMKTTEVATTMFATAARNLVLDEYDPTRYKRRSDTGSYEGTTGIANPKSYDVSVGDLFVKIESNVQGNPRYSMNKDGWYSGNITDIIESGKGYHWKRSEIYQTQQPRPWMEEAGDAYTKEYVAPLIDWVAADYFGGGGSGGFELTDCGDGGGHSTTDASDYDLPF